MRGMVFIYKDDTMQPYYVQIFIHVLVDKVLELYAQKEILQRIDRSSMRLKIFATLNYNNLPNVDGKIYD